MVETIFSNPFVLEIIFPFLLIFVVIFAILQKAKILGEGKTQIDAITALVLALIFVSVGNATGIIVNLIPFLGVSLVVILVFLILVGSFMGKIELPKSVNIILGVLAALVVIAGLIYASGSWDAVKNFFTGENKSIVYNAITIIVVIAAVVAVVVGGKGSSEEKK